MSVKATHEKISALWGTDLTDPAGVVHVTAVGHDDGGRLAVIRIGPQAPRSRTDFFSLSLARARADAIVTTGNILRSEAEVSHDPGPELRAWRREVLGKPKPPVLVVLTRGSDLPVEHPVLHNPGVLLATGGESATSLEARLRGRGIGILALPEPSPRGLIQELRRREMQTICLEAGPSTSIGLYDDPLAIDELMLSSWEQAPLPGPLIAGTFLDEASLHRCFGSARHEVQTEEESGRWRFRRFGTNQSRAPH